MKKNYSTSRLRLISEHSPTILFSLAIIIFLLFFLSVASLAQTTTDRKKTNSAATQTTPTNEKIVTLTFQTNFQAEDSENIKNIITTDMGYGVLDFSVDIEQKKMTLKMNNDELALRRVLKLIDAMGYKATVRIQNPH